MQRDDYPMIEDLLKLASNLANLVFDKAKEARSREGLKSAGRPVKGLFQNLSVLLDLPSRDDMDAAFTMMGKIRAAQEALEARLDALENKKTGKKDAPSKTKKKKPVRAVLRAASSRKPVRQARKKNR